MVDTDIDARERIYGGIEELLEGFLPSWYLIERNAHTDPKGSVSPDEDFIDCMSWIISIPDHDNKLELKVFRYDFDYVEFEIYGSEFGPNMPDAYCPISLIEKTIKILVDEIRLRMGDIDDER